MIWPYIILSYLTLIVFGLCDNIRGPLFPELLRDFNLTNFHGSLFYVVASSFSFAGSWVCFHLLKKIDRVQNLYLALALLGIGLWGVGLSQSFSQLLGAAAVVGVGYGLIQVSYNILATIGSSAQRRQRVISGLHTMYGLSGFLAPLFVTAVYARGGRWTHVFFAAAILCWTLGFVSVWFLRKETGVGFIPPPVGEPKPLRGVRIVALASGFYVVAEIMIGSRLALFLRLEKGFDLPRSSYYVTGFFLGLLISRALFMFFPPAFKIRHQLLVSLAFSFVSLVLALFVHEAFFVVTGFAMGPYFALSILYLAEVFPQSLNQAIATAMATSSLMVLLMHLSSGWLTDHFGVARAMLAGPVFLLAAIVFLKGSVRWTGP